MGSVSPWIRQRRSQIWPSPVVEARRPASGSDEVERGVAEANGAEHAARPLHTVCHLGPLASGGGVGPPDLLMF